MNTNLATFQTECPTYEEFEQSHVKQVFVYMKDVASVKWSTVIESEKTVLVNGVILF